ncbi:MAG: hypothetical protein HY354_04635, partial [Planctomycetes bacterium]|nr:hypothetical protein [Planctomycetota bacterium]
TSTSTTTTKAPTTTSSTTTTTTVTTTTTLPPNICADPVSFYFEATLPGPNPEGQMLEVYECKGSNLSWSAQRSNTWLQLSQMADDPNLLDVSVDVSGISSAGTYNGSITILAYGAANSPLRIPVTLKAIKAPLPVENLEARRWDDIIILKWDANEAYDLSGYKVYYDFDSSQPPYDGTGAAEGNSGEIFIDGAETAQLTGLPEGVMYVAVTAFDYEGNESGYSEAIIPNSVSINDGDDIALSRSVTLYLTYGDGITHVSISNDGERWSSWRTANPVIRDWSLTKGAGEKSVYVKFKGNGKIYEPAKDTILKERKRALYR